MAVLSWLMVLALRGVLELIWLRRAVVEGEGGGRVLAMLVTEETPLLMLELMAEDWVLKELVIEFIRLLMLVLVASGSR